MLKLDDRLSLCASFVREGAALADIGTDHGYLPIWLLLNKKIKYAVAADVRESPLERAKVNIKRYGLKDEIKTVLSDGLDNIEVDEVDDIVMAGMGGELIVRLIDRTPWLKDAKKNLILQPMTRAEILREYLYNNGFDIKNEKACISFGKTYSVMLVSYNGIIKQYSIKDKYIGTLENDKSYEAKCYIDTVNRKLKKKIIGYETGTEEYNSLELLIAELNEIIDTEELK